MNHRRYMVPIALVGAFGIALTPALATASTGSNGSTASKGSTTGDATPNPGMYINAGNINTSAHCVQFTVTPGDFVSGTATISVGWGDQSSDTQTVTAPVKNAPIVLDFPHTYAKLGVYQVVVHATDGQGDNAVNGAVVETGSQYVPYGPTRILDTRSAGASGAIAPHGTYALKVVGAGPAGDTIPAGVTAVALNVTATEATGNGYLTVYGDDTFGDGPVGLPGTSNLNFGANQNIANLVIAPVGADGTVDFYNGAPHGSVQVVADLAGYFTTSVHNTYAAVGPTRILDTRGGVGAPKAPIGANKTLNVTVAGGSDGVPADATAVAVHLTTVDSTRNGLIAAFPAGQNAPDVSNLNYGAGSTTSNTAVVPVGANGQISLQNTSTGTTDVIGDIAGYFTEDQATGSSDYLPFQSPVRYIDTRPGANDALNGQGPLLGPLNSDVIYPFALTTSAAVPAMVANATVVSPTGDGALALAPNDILNPESSNLDYLTGQTVTGLAFVSPSVTADSAGNYDAAVYQFGSGSVELIVDEFGEFIE